MVAHIVGIRIASMARKPRMDRIQVSLNLTNFVLPYIAVAVEPIKHRVLNGPSTTNRSTLIRPYESPVKSDIFSMMAMQ